MAELKGVLAKTRTYLYIVAICVFASFLTNPISKLTGMSLKRLEFGFVAIITFELVVIFLYNIKFASDVVLKKNAEAPKKGKKQVSRKKSEKYEEILNSAARIRVFTILVAVLLIVQVLAFNFLNILILTLLLKLTEVSLLIFSLQELTKLQRMM